MNIKLIDLQASHARIKDKVDQRIEKVFEHGKFILGPEVSELEEKLASYVGVKHTITCANGTDALFLCLLAHKIGPGDAVFTTPFTFIATAEVIALAGATPVFVDVDKDSKNIDPEALKQKISETKKNGKLSPKAIIAVDLFGLVADYPNLQKIANENNLTLIEDGAQSFGASMCNQKSGSFGDLAATSFFPAKPLGCYGDGGAIFTNHGGLDKILRSLRVHGQGEERYENIKVGINSRLDTLQAAFLLERIEILDSEIQMRKSIANHYTSGLKNLVETPIIPEGYESAWAQYSIVVNNRSKLVESLKQKEIPHAIFYPIPIHLQKAFESCGYEKGDFPISENIAENIISLPIQPYLSEEQVDFIIATVKSCVGQNT